MSASRQPGAAVANYSPIKVAIACHTTVASRTYVQRFVGQAYAFLIFQCSGLPERTMSMMFARVAVG
jgi:hypothetical protein